MEGVDGFSEQSCSMVALHEMRNRAFWLILTAKNLNFQAQRLYWAPTIEITYANEFPDQSCPMIALHDFASRGL